MLTKSAAVRRCWNSLVSWPRRVQQQSASSQEMLNEVSATKQGCGCPVVRVFVRRHGMEGLDISTQQGIHMPVACMLIQDSKRLCVHGRTG